MKRFHFRLQSVLRVREFELDRASAVLARLEAERRRREERCEELTRGLEEARAQLDAQTRSGIDGQQIGLRAEGLAVGRIVLARAEHALGELSAPLAQARDRVREARVRVKSLERLRENRASLHRAETLSAEQAELEELARSARGASDRAASDRLAGRVA